MANIKRLVESNQLKTSYLSKIQHKGSFFFNFDDQSDILMLLFVSPKTKTIVHYVDRYVSILYTPDDFEIVGLQIEDFQSDFIPLYSELQKAWCLSNFVVNNENIWDLTLRVEERKLNVALQVIRAKHKVIGKPAKEFERVLERV